MRRSICVCEPTYTLAGNTGTWKFVYTTANLLPKGTKLRFDLGSQGRSIDWQIPITNPKEKSNQIWGELPSGKIVVAEQVSQPEDPSYVAFEFQIPVELKSGDVFKIIMGAPEKAPGLGNTSQKTVQRRRSFNLHIDPKGKGDYKELETFHLDVRGGPLKSLRIITPSLVTRNKRFDVMVRFEDIYGNLTSNAPEGTVIDLSYEHLRENLNWKLFVPETGFIALPSLYFNEPGIYKIQLHNLKTDEYFFSAPIKCIFENPLSLFWGNLFGESKRYNSTTQIESWIRHMRDDSGLQFVATSCFETEEETSNDDWKNISAQIAEFNEDDRFVAMLGFQWLGEPGPEGLRHFIYSKDAKPILRRKDTKNNSLKKIYKTNNPKEMIAVPVFTMGKTTCFDFEDFNPEYERVVQIFMAWGSSENHSKDKNLKAIAGSGKNSIPETAEGSIVKALNNGCRFGFVAGGYHDGGPFADLFDSNQVQYTEGITAILAKEHNRSSLMDALHARSCYASTGERIILGFDIAGFGMGGEVDTKTRPGLEYNRYITGYCVGTKPLTEVAIIRNGKVWRTLDCNGDRLDIETEDTEALSSIALEGKEDKPPFAYYYLRVTQADGHMAWSSPIWIDQNTKASTFLPKKTKKKVKDVD
jgi:hypothetical protein